MIRKKSNTIIYSLETERDGFINNIFLTNMRYNILNKDLNR